MHYTPPSRTRRGSRRGETSAAHDPVRKACGSTSEQVRVSPRQGRPSGPPGPIPETSAIAPIDLYGLTKLQGGGQLRPGEVVLRLCASILDHSLEVDVGERRRAQDRAELVADPTLLPEERGLAAHLPLRATAAARLIGA